MQSSYAPETPNAGTQPMRSAEQIAAQRARDRRMRTVLLEVLGVVLLVVVLLVVLVVFLLQPGVPTERIRDIFVIVVSLETLVIGVALVVLLVQLAGLINLLQNEVRPILSATSETLNTLRGTADFLSESVVEPVVKLNTYLASVQRVLELMGIKRK
jgi:Na+/H+ antiporter NhaC